jgi:putative NADH-flavin reductase
MNIKPKLNLLLFGATRNTGYHFMQQALDAGHQVTAIVRNPAAFDFKHPNLKVVKGDALQIQTFENEVTGKDAVVSSLGVTNIKEPTTLVSAGVANMMEAMRKKGVNRIICVSAMALDTNSKTGIFLTLASKVVQWVLKEPYKDSRRMEAELKSSTLNWTIVRAPRLKNKPLTGKYRVAIGDHLSVPMTIGRADVARCILQHITDESTFQKTIEIAY